MTLAEIRAKYPQYDSMPDDVLAQKLYDKSYSGKISFEDFSQRIGMPSQQVLPVNDVPKTDAEGSQTFGQDLLDTGKGLLEVGSAIGGGMLGAIFGGYAGLSELVQGEGVDAAVKKLNEVRDSLSSQPETDEGKSQLELISKSLETLTGIGNSAIGGASGLANIALRPSQGIEGAKDDVNAIKEKGFGKALGQETLNITGSPALATAAELTPELAGSIFAKLKAGSKTPVKSKLIQKIESNPNDPSMSKYMVTTEGKIKSDVGAKKAIRQGFDDGVIAVVKNASKTDKNNMLRMVGKLEKSNKDALYAAKNRPADVAGETLSRRVKFVKDKNTSSGLELESVAKNLKGKSVNFDQAVDSFKLDLENMGVELGGDLKPSFKGSDIEGVKGAEQAITKIIARMKNQKDVDAYGVHRIKKFIDEQVTYGKSVKGLGGKSERILKALRRNLDSSLDDAFPEYNRVNTTYSDTITAIDELQLAAGKKLDLYGNNSDKATGTLLRRLMSNAQGRVTLMDAIDSIESVGKKYGAKFDDDITTQVLFADELDRVFGAPAKTSFQGEIAKATTQASQGQAGMVSMGVEKLGGVLEKARGINKESALKSIRELLKEGNK